MSDKLGDPDDENGRDQAVDGAKPRYALTDKPRTLLTNKIVDQVRKNRDPEKGEDHPFHLLKLHRFTHISLEVPRFSVDPGGFLLICRDAPSRPSWEGASSARAGPV